jgi:hypothetical protein
MFLLSRISSRIAVVIPQLCKALGKIPTRVVFDSIVKTGRHYTANAGSILAK